MYEKHTEGNPSESSLEGVISLKKLEAYRHEGRYCFHGSPTEKLTLLEPRPPVGDVSGDPNRNQEAVYADPDDYLLPLLRALWRKKDPTKALGMRISTRSGVPEIFGDQENIEWSNGSIYILSRNSFNDFGSAAYQSNTPVAVIDEIQVTPDTFKKLIESRRIISHITPT